MQNPYLIFWCRGLSQEDRRGTNMNEIGMRTLLLILLFASTTAAARYRADFELPLKVFGHDGSWKVAAYLDQDLFRIEAQHSLNEAQFTAISRGHVIPLSIGGLDIPSMEQRRWIRYPITFSIEDRLDEIYFRTNGWVEFNFTRPGYPQPSTANLYISQVKPPGIIHFKATGFGGRQEVNFHEVPAGDVDGNLNVDFSDFLILSAHFGQEADSLLEGDLDFSGRVDFADFLLLSNNFGNSEVSAVPEPNSLMLFLVGLFSSAITRKPSIVAFDKRD